MRTSPLRVFPLHILLLLAVGIFCINTSAQAEKRGLSLSQTRVVFDAGVPAVTVTLRNHSDRPWLTQAQVLISPDGTLAAPFMITPPLFRLEPNSESTVKVLRRGTASLPTDRESVFYLSFLTIPASERQTTEMPSEVSARVTVGVNSVIKLFYRPTGLTPTPQAAAEKLTVIQQKGRVIVTNPTPYYQTLASFSLDGKPVEIRSAGSMIAPFTSQDYSVPLLSNHFREASWTVVNDYGGNSPIYRTQVNNSEETQP